jgi:hypothetical protein
MKETCVLFSLNLKNKDVHLILAQILSNGAKITHTNLFGARYFYTLTYSE